LARRCLARGSNICDTILAGLLEPALELLDQLSPLGWNTVSGVIMESTAGLAIRVCSDLVQIACRQATSVRASMSRIASARGRSYACLATSLLPKKTSAVRGSGIAGGSQVTPCPSGYRTAKSCLESTDFEKPDKQIADLPFPPSSMSRLTSSVSRDGYVDHRPILDRAVLPRGRQLPRGSKAIRD